MGQDRAIRIAELLEQRRDWALEDVREMRLDVYSKQAERFMAILRPLLPAGAPSGVMREWDCRYDADSRGADLFERFYHELLEVFGATCSPEVARYLLAETAFVPGCLPASTRRSWTSTAAGTRQTAARPAWRRPIASAPTSPSLPRTPRCPAAPPTAASRCRNRARSDRSQGPPAANPRRQHRSRERMGGPGPVPHGLLRRAGEQEAACDHPHPSPLARKTKTT
jgi:Penicillin amidase